MGSQLRMVLYLKGEKVCKGGVSHPEAKGDLLRECSAAIDLERLLYGVRRSAHE